MTLEGVITGGGARFTKCVRLTQPILPTEQYLSGGGSGFAFDILDPFTIVVWFKTSATGAMTLVTDHETGVYRGYWVHVTSLVPHMIFGHDTTPGNYDEYSFGSAVTANVWHQLVICHTSLNGVTAYVDGVLVTTTQTSTGVLTTRVSNGALTIGAFVDPGNPYTGYLDDLAIYSRVLSAGDVTAIYNGGHPINYAVAISTTGLVRYFRMGDESGDSDSVISGTAPVNSFFLTGHNLSSSIVNRT